MNKTSIITVAAITLMSASPAFAGGLLGGLFGGIGGRHGSSSSSSTGGAPSSSSTGSTSSGATSVPEPSDAVLVLMGAAGVIIGRRMHKRSKKG